MSTKLIIATILVLLGFGVGYSIRRTETITVIQEAKPVVKIVKEYIDSPVYITKWETITSTNALEVAEELQTEVTKWEDADLKVNITPYTVINSALPSTLNMQAELYRRKWDLVIINNYKVVEEINNIETFGMGFGYNLYERKPYINFYKQLGVMPIVNLPISVGISFTLR